MIETRLLGILQSLHNRLDQLTALFERLEEKVTALQMNSITFNVTEHVDAASTQASETEEESDETQLSDFSWESAATWP